MCLLDMACGWIAAGDKRERDNENEVKYCCCDQAGEGDSEEGVYVKGDSRQIHKPKIT